MQGVNDRTIMELGGWKSTAMLSRYAHLSPAHLWKAVEGLIQFGTVTEAVTGETVTDDQAQNLLAELIE